MKRKRARDHQQQLSLDLASLRSQEPKSMPAGRAGKVVALKDFANKKQNSTKTLALRKVLDHARSLSW